MRDYSVIDSDGHVLESMEGIRERLEPHWRRNILRPTDYWDRDLRGKIGQQPRSPEEQLAAMDQDEIDVMVLYPTAYLCIGTMRERSFCTAVTRAYNTWVHEFCETNPKRLKFVAIIAPQEVDEAAQELRRAVTTLGAVGAMLPTYIPNRPDWGDTSFDPVYAEAERLNVPLGFHASMLESIGAQRFNNFINVHTVGHPVEQMISVCSVIIGGVLDRFPRLRLGFLESGIGWIPYLMDRLDEEIEKRGEDEAPSLKARPSEYLTSGQCFFGVECGEKTIADAIRTTGDDCLLYASDYPHWDGDWPHTVRTIADRTDLSENTKRKMLHDNVARFYGLDS